jgi:ABC-type lipoprotein release transport system permease subunit
MQSFIWGVEARDTAAFLAVPALLIAASAIATYLPAARGARIDPLGALRHE